jgi:hypothetical protein
MQRDGIQGLLGAVGCTAAGAQCTDVGQKAYKATIEKASNVNVPSALAVGGCLFLLGYCAGKVSTKAIDKFLGFE